MTNNFVFEPNLSAKTIHIGCEFTAPIEKVWKAFTEANLLDKWVAPKPWTAETKIMDFTVGGIWLYAMVGTEGQKQWVYTEFTAIENGIAFSSIGKFCDGEGNPVLEGPKSYKDTTFSSVGGNKTKVDVVITFEDEATIKMFVEMGFEAGSAMSYNNLTELLASEPVQ